MKPDTFISKLSNEAFRDGNKSAAAENEMQYYWLRQQQRKALAERDYFKKWGTTKY